MRVVFSIFLSVLPLVASADEFDQAYWGARLAVYDQTWKDAFRNDLGKSPPVYVKGLVVVEVQPGGFFEKANMRPFDLVTQLNDAKVEKIEDLQQFKPGDSIKATGYRFIKAENKRGKWEKGEVEVKLENLRAFILSQFTRKPSDLDVALFIHHCAIPVESISDGRSTYLNFRIDEKNNTFSLVATVEVYRDDWLFIKSGHIIAGDLRTPVAPPNETSSRKVEQSGGVREWYSCKLNEQDIRKVVEAESPSLVLVGNKEYEKFEIPKECLFKARMCLRYLEILRASKDPG